MKRFLSILSVVCVLASCENGGLPEGPHSEPKPIIFGEVSTRADVEEDEATKTKRDIEDNGFGVYAFVNNQANPLYSLFGDNQEEVNKDSGEWTYSNIKNWAPNSEYHFHGVYPYNNTTSTLSKDASGNITGFNYSFEVGEAADADFLTAYTYVATDAECNPSGVSGEDQSVKMNFSHALARVFFKITFDHTESGNRGDEFYLKEFSISNIKSVGSLTAAFDGRVEEGQDYRSWSVNSLRNINFTMSYGDDGVLLEAAEDVNLWENGLMLIPQTFAASAVNIKVKYGFINHSVVDGEDDSEPRVEKEVNTYLPAITWKPGVQYTYIMKLHEDEFITFKQIELATWGSPQQGGAIIIK